LSSQSNLIQLDQNGNIPKSQQKSKTGSTWKYLNGVAFFTQQGASVKVKLLESQNGTRIVSISKGKQYVAIAESDVEKLFKAINNVFEYSQRPNKP